MLCILSIVILGKVIVFQVTYLTYIFLPLCVCDNDRQHDNIACVFDVEKLDEPYASV